MKPSFFQLLWAAVCRLPDSGNTLLRRGQILSRTPARCTPAIKGRRSFLLRNALVLAWLLFAAINVHADWTLKTIYNFGLEDPSAFPPTPTSALVTPDNTFLYGATQNGGSHGTGSLFAISTDGSLYVVLKSFEFSEDGSSVNGGLVLSPDGTTLYGAAGAGGSNNSGTVFSFDLANVPNPFKILYTFSALDGCQRNSDGASPQGGLVVAPDGKSLYGATFGGGPNTCVPMAPGSGTIFIVGATAGEANYTVLHSFDDLADSFINNDGAQPNGLVGAGVGLFGSTYSGGTNSCGTVFTFDTLLNQFTVLHTFNELTDGVFPDANLLLSGVWLYGTTETAQAFGGDGTVFKVKIDGSGYKRLYTWPAGGGAVFPNALVFGGDGLLYGTTYSGGAIGFGSVFSLSTDGTYFSEIHSFSFLDGASENSDGQLPMAGLLSSGGALYGTTTRGGTNDCGTVFQLTYHPSFQQVALVPGVGMILGFAPAPGRQRLILQTATSLSGGFTNIPGATSPYTNPITEPQRFFRLVLDTNISPAGPDAATAPASVFGPASAILNGNVVANGADTTAWFQYGTTTNYGQITSNTLVSTANTNVVGVSNIINGLAPGTLYHFQVLASNSVGTDTGADITFVTPSPPAVTTLAATALTSTSATLNGSITPDGADTTWWFEYGLDTNYAGGITSSGVVSASNTNAVSVSSPIGGLVAGTVYHFQLVGTNSAGTNNGGDVTFTTPLPPILTTFAATSVTTTTAVLNGSVYGNGSAIAGYFQYGVDTNYGDSTFGSQFYGTGNPVQGFSTTISNLSPSTTYQYRIIAFNCCAEGFGSDTNFTTAWAPVPPTLLSPGTNAPAGPTLATLTPLFTWNASTQASSSDLSISQYPYGSGNVVFTAGVGTASSYQIPGGILQPGTPYAWYMDSFNGIGDDSGPSPSFYFQTPAQPAVQTLTPTNVILNSSELLGAVNPNGLTTTVYFEYGTNTSYGNSTTMTNIGTTAQTVGATVSLGRSIQYHYRIDAVNSLGTSLGSDVSFMSQ